jgi:AcrR family transcriptional regulator
MTRSSKPAANDQDTRARLLDAAIRLFADAGFKRVTVRAICRAAHANVAAVNYHFRNKLGLYREVTEVGITVLQETTTLAVQAASTGTPEEQLRAYIRVVTERLVGSMGHEWLQRFIAREMADPTPALASLVDRGLRPRLEHLGRIIAEILGWPTDDPRVLECVTSTHAQILMFRDNPITHRLRARAKLRAATPEEIADHITMFSLAGIRAIRDRATASAGPAR